MPPLHFDDPALEREWWDWYASEQSRVLRGGVVVLVAGLVAFLALDALLWPDLLGRLAAVRVATLALIAPALPAFARADSVARLGARAQERLLYVGAVTLAGLCGISWILLPTLTDERAFAAVLALQVLLSGLYGVSGLRFRYAAGLGVAATLLFLVGVLLRATPPPGLFLALATFGVAANVVGMVLSRSMETSARRTFLRARELAAERQRSEALLLNVMPRVWADRLETGAARLDRVPDAAVLFASVVGFAEAAAGRSPLEAVELLDAVVARLDALTTAHGAERIKTVGVTYIAAVGVHGPVEADAAARAAELALAMRAAVEELGKERHIRLGLRVGMAAGPVVVGVIGRSRYAFDCWGDTVNTAARLDASGEAGRVHTTVATAARLVGRRVAVRGLTELKGKGAVETAWVDA